MNRAERRRREKQEAKLKRPAQPTGRQRCAVHEAGHVVVARSFGLPVSEVTIDSVRSDAFGELEGHTARGSRIYDRNGIRSDATAEEKRVEALVTLAGLAADLLTKRPRREAWLGAAQEPYRAASLLGCEVGDVAFGEALREAGTIIEANRERVEAIVAALLEHGTLDEAAIRGLLIQEVTTCEPQSS